MGCGQTKVFDLGQLGAAQSNEADRGGRCVLRDSEPGTVCCPSKAFLVGKRETWSPHDPGRAGFVTLFWVVSGIIGIVEKTPSTPDHTLFKECPTSLAHGPCENEDRSA